MDIWLVDWYQPLLVEANKLWFYAICISLARSLIYLSTRSDKETKDKSSGAKGEKKVKESPSPSIPSRSSLVKRLLVDSCDLTLPGSCVGWLEIGDIGIGLAMVVSTLLPLAEMWATFDQ